jgi:threonine dehydrogenase-like Zn-dependent dehydrogenase
MVSRSPQLPPPPLLLLLLLLPPPAAAVPPRGDRVLVAFDIKCGNCFFCSKQLYSSCDKTNPSEVNEFMYGQVSCGTGG